MDDDNHLSVTALVLFLGALLAITAISGQSLWIDEANTAVIAIADCFASFLEGLEADKGSTMQMPLYMLALWCWEKIVGPSEFALRAMNLPIFLVGLLAVGKYMIANRAIKVFYVILACFSPFLWAYLDEARPYILQFTGSLLALIGLWNCIIRESQSKNHSTRLPLRDLVLFSAGIVLLCGSSLIGVIYSFFFGVTFLVLWLRRERFSMIFRRVDFYFIVGISGTILASLAIYYAWTLQVGAKASNVGKTNLMSLGFALFEILGFAGLGPGRAELRENPVAALKPYLPILGTYAAVFTIFLSAGIWNFFRVHRFLLVFSIELVKLTFILITILLVCAGTIAVLGVVGQFRIVGRHFMPLFPFVVLFLASIAVGIWESQKNTMRFIAGLFLLAWLASAVTYRLSPAHAKDDYRSAAATAIETLNKGGVVWWAADVAAAKYYGLPKMDQGIPIPWKDSRTAIVVAVSNLTSQDLGELPFPSLVLLSKEDIYDNSGSIVCYLQKNSFQINRNQVPAFSFANKTAPNN